MLCGFKRMSLAVVVFVATAANDFNLTQVDIKQAYLQATVTEDLYMRVPEGLPNRDEQGRPLVCKLQRSLYGLRQAGREWGNCLSDHLVGYGFKRSTIDTCLYMLTRGDAFIWLAVYVDDILCLDNNASLRERVIKDLDSRFSLSDKGNLHWLLGVEITRDRKARSISLSSFAWMSAAAAYFFCASMAAINGAYVSSSSARRHEFFHSLRHFMFYEMLHNRTESRIAQ